MIEIARPYYAPTAGHFVLRFFCPRGGAVQAPWLCLDDMLRGIGVPDHDGNALVARFRGTAPHLYRTIYFDGTKLTVLNSRNSIELIALLLIDGLAIQEWADEVERLISNTAPGYLLRHTFPDFVGSTDEHPDAERFCIGMQDDVQTAESVAQLGGELFAGLHSNRKHSEGFAG